MIYSIQRYCLHDGRGIRTTIFFKGCPLRCPWCANPESQHFEPEIGYYPEKCLNCGLCSSVCPQPIRASAPPYIAASSDCTSCGNCAESCPSGALKRFGLVMDADQIVEEICRDLPFYHSSGGGVTFSGGEAVLQPKLLHPILERMRTLSIHTALESNALFSTKEREYLCAYIDQFLLDLKHMDDSIHRRILGVSNRQCLENLRALSDRDLTIRIPLIPGFNMDEENLKRCAEFAASLQVPVDLLPFHNYGSSKYRALSRIYAYADTPRSSPETIAAVRCLFQSYGVRLADM